jgi:hypothetical protein
LEKTFPKPASRAIWGVRKEKPTDTDTTLVVTGIALCHPVYFVVFYFSDHVVLVGLELLMLLPLPPECWCVLPLPIHPIYFFVQHVGVHFPGPEKNRTTTEVCVLIPISPVRTEI